MKYVEDKNITESYKKNYVDGLEYTLNKRQRIAEKVREQYVKKNF